MISVRRWSVLVLLVLLALIIVSCGGSKATEPNGPMITSPVGGQAPAATSERPKDEQAEKAKAFCDHEIELSSTQPPDNLSRKQVVACLTAIRPDYQIKCGKGIQRSVFLKIIVEKSGMVSDAFPLGDSADSPEAKCVSELVTEAKFPQFKASNQQVIQKYKFEIEP